MNASISEDSSYVVKGAQVCTEGTTKKLGTRFSISGHGSGSKGGKMPGELRQPEKSSGGSSNGGPKSMKMDRY